MKFKEFYLREKSDVSESDGLDILLSKFNITYEDLHWLGSGDFGNAYLMGNDLVLKCTSSFSEFEIASEIMKGKFSSFATIHAVEKIGSDYYIVMEELEIESEIESLYYEVSNILESNGTPIQYIGNFDIDEYETENGEIDSGVKDFMNELYGIVHDYRKLGIESSDIKPENMGRSKKDGSLKAFDIEDRSRNH